MPCIKGPPAPTLPTLPGGVSLTVFTPPSPINLGLCCNNATIAFPIGAVAIPIAIPAAAQTLLSQYNDAIAAVFDAIQVPCPSE